MAKVKNISSLGDLNIPALGLDVLAGETIEVPDDVAASLLDQPSNWISGESNSSKSTPDAAPAAE
jgi:hypothetical protein